MIRRWQTGTRYYVADLHRDLLDDVVVVSIAGGRYNRLGHVETLAVGTWENGLEVLDKIAERRRRHHYTEISQ